MTLQKRLRVLGSIPARTVSPASSAAMIAVKLVCGKRAATAVSRFPILKKSPPAKPDFLRKHQMIA
jgi:hypothetical protein